jgi:hypothetical protein
LALSWSGRHGILKDARHISIGVFFEDEKGEMRSTLLHISDWRCFETLQGEAEAIAALRFVASGR